MAADPVHPVGPVGVVRLLEVDPDLGEALAPVARAAAAEAAVVPVLGVDRGPWAAPAEPPSRGSAIGLFVVSGLLLRTVVLRRRYSELVGPGDLIRPWDRSDADGSLGATVEWHVVRPAQVALLDRRFAQSIATWPELLSEIAARALRTAARQSVMAALTSEPRVETRLLMVFWHLAERWGRVTPDGVVVDLPLSHERIAELVGTQRPTATTALGALARRGLLVRRDRTSWTLAPAAQDGLESLRRAAGATAL